MASRKDRREKILLNTNRTFRPQGLPQQNREQSGEERSYIPVPRQWDIGAPVPGWVKQVKGGGGSRRSEGIGLMHAHAYGEGGRGYIPVPRHQCTGARYDKSRKRGIRSRRNEEIGLMHAQGENEKCRNWHRKYRNRLNHVRVHCTRMPRPSSRFSTVNSWDPLSLHSFSRSRRCTMPSWRPLQSCDSPGVVSVREVDCDGRVFIVFDGGTMVIHPLS